MDRLAALHRNELIDLLAERMAFERAGAELYDAIIEKIDRSHDSALLPLLDTLREHREQELEHEKWLAGQIRALGGDVDQKTDRVRMIETESKGIKEVILGGDFVPAHLFHALLAAELLDNEGWELLLELADEADDDEARGAFADRLHEEEEHVLFARRAVVAFARREVLGFEAAAAMPTSPL
jgi:bacterioferritin (cytochrome b1)